jgi:gas vesicle protein
MKRIFLLLILLACLATTSAARSQQPTSKAPASGKQTTQLDDSLRYKPSPELQKSLDDLALAMQALAHRIASDPEIKSAAIQVASGFVNTAQKVVTEQSDILQEALKTAAERIADAQSIRHQRAKKP